MSLFNELNRRNVLRVATAYVVTSWLLIQVAETIFPLFGYGDGPARMVVTLLAVGFIPVLIFAWAFEWTPEGIRKESEVDRSKSVTGTTGKKLDRVIMVVLALALGYFAFDKFVLDPRRDEAIAKAATEAAVEQVREEALLGMMSAKSIAVLPFDNRSNLDEDLFFTDGMHDELLTRLSRISALKVISRTSVMRYRDSLLSIPDIAKELSVATILEGGVQRAGNQVRINVQLIDARTDEHLWAEIYDRELTTENLFAIQSEISEAISESLHATLSPEERKRITDLPTDDLEAYNHYLRGRQLFATRTREGLQQGYEEFQKAVELDPDFALAWVGIADSVQLLHFNRVIPDWDEQIDLRQEAVNTALAINDQLGEAYASLGFLYFNQGETEKSEAAFTRAIELNPNYAQAYHWYAMTVPRRSQAEREETLRLYYKAAELDPMSSIIQANLAANLMSGGENADTENNQEGKQVMSALLERDPDFATALRMLADYQADWGQLANAVLNYRKSLKIDPENVRTLGTLALLHVSLGDFEGFEAVRSDLYKYTTPYQADRLELEFNSLRAQAKWDEALRLLADLPESAPGGWRHPWRTTWMYSFSGQYDKALESLLTWQERVLDPEAWQDGAGGTDESNCFYADILIGAGEEKKGRQLLQTIIDNLNSMTEEESKYQANISYRVECYLLNKEFDRAMDLVESSLSHSSIVEDWYTWRYLPGWKLYKNNPHYQAMVAKIEGLIAEQRALLAEMESPATQ